MKIGQNAKPLDGDPELSATQKRVIQNNIKPIKKAVSQIGKWYRLTQKGKE